ncbi:TonB-dependent receptor plug domain-containing protein, partial [Butyricimonas sp. An62]|uniref:TonB-dependent receptor plug domain-containing protein n=1 Tax=Butyricimonas sp. An62 TaxID=1965649 RepID=UPI002356ABDD
VLEKGVQGNGTITDIDGIFKLSVSSSKAQLDISYIGYQSQTVAVQVGKNLKIIIQEDSKQLEEVVVVGYGTQSKKTLTGAVSMVNMGDVEMNTVPNVSRALAGKAAGFRVNQISAQPGGEAKFRIRGEASTGAGNDPLFVIDGFPVSSSGNLSSGNGYYESGNIDNVLESLNPDDIESISVLKDAASTAIYGARAGHGVVLITTKRGKSQKPRVTYSGMGSVQVARSNYKMLDTRMYMDMYNKQQHEEWLKLNGMGIYEGYVEKPDTPSTQYKPAFNNDEILLASGTDWLDAVMRNGYTQQHNLSVNGGTEKTRYLASVNYMDQEGIVKNNG